MGNTRAPGVLGIHDEENQVCRPYTFYDLLASVDEPYAVSPYRWPVGMSHESDGEPQPGNPELRKGMYDDRAVDKYGKSKDHDGYVEGEHVYRLQTRLKAFGFTEVGNPDGDFGRKTEAAVKNFQGVATGVKRLKLQGEKDKVVDVEPTYTGPAGGIVDLPTWKEIGIWAQNDYRLPLLTVKNTSHQYQPTRMPLQDCIDTLPSQLRKDFRDKIVTVIEAMHKIGFAFGSWDKVKAGYRTFQQQYEIDPSKTRAGPGESFHNYGMAVDLGCLNWVDKSGKSRDKDFWLGGMLPVAFANAVWDQRNALAPAGVHVLSWEKIHMQAVVASTSGRAALVKCLNAATAASAEHTKWKYDTGAGSTYRCTMGTEDQWTVIGTAKQMWNKTATHCTAGQRDIIRSHMELAEAKALTILIP